uniref:Ig-like domain-containing protein n=1 Tax=Fodinibius sp. TaxID=1872440 RepID=UPI003562FA3F
MIQSADYGVCEAYVTVDEPLTTGNCFADSLWNSWTGTSNASAIYPVGIWTVWWYIVGENGEVDSCFHTVTVIDDQPPDIVCPPDTTVFASPDSCWAFVDPGYATATDNCGVDSIWNSYTGGPVAAALYPVGTTIVTWWAVDIHGNTSQCQMTVTVVDSIPPTIICPPDTLLPADPGVCEAYVAIDPAIPWDNCDIDSFWNDYNFTADASDTYPVGTTVVNWYVVDGSGLMDSCSHVVTVYDDQPPVIICQNDTMVFAATGECEAFVNMQMPYVFDNCGIDTLWNSYTGTTELGAIFPNGTTEVTWTVIDIHGLQSQCSFNVTVVTVVDAVDDFVTTDMNVPVDIYPLLNDIFCSSIFDSAALTITEGPDHGIYYWYAFGTVTYSPEFNYSGFDTMTYIICDTTGYCDEAIIVIFIRDETNNPPVAVNDYAITPMCLPVDIDILANDYDPDGDSIYLIEIYERPMNGQIKLNDDKTVTYRPDIGYTGVDKFAYFIRDGGIPNMYDSATVLITIEDVPLEDIPFHIYNALTPNADGDNDYWKMLNIEYFPDNEVILMDRWGRVIREYKGYNNASIRWEGYDNNGNLLPNATYYYVVKLGFQGRMYKGWVMLQK